MPGLHQSITLDLQNAFPFFKKQNKKPSEQLKCACNSSRGVPEWTPA